LAFLPNIIPRLFASLFSNEWHLCFLQKCVLIITFLFGVTVWGALSSEDVTGPVFFGGTVDGNNYLNMLRDMVVPQFTTKSYIAELYFQQDGELLIMRC
jgi:hypothetical protein